MDKALKKLRKILSADTEKQLEKSRSLRKVLHSLRLEKKRLEDRLQDSESEREREEIVQRLKVLTKHREKGAQLLQELEPGDQDDAPEK